MALRINNDRVSSRSWGEIDKSALWQRLKQALQESEAGAAEAVREVYAAIKADVTPDLREADCWGPHHEITPEGIVLLNRGGLIAAAQALAGARSDPSLTDAQRRQAAAHLLRHYRSIDGLTPPESLVSVAGEMVQLAATVSGEVSVQDVPVAPWADLTALKMGDPDPMEVVVEVPAGRSKRGWNYTPAALQRIVGEVMGQGLPGFLGHQKPEDVDHEFPKPVTHWVGAKFENGKAYFRGVVDAAASDLKRWLRAKTVRTVSIFGIPELQRVGGETNVVDYKPLSIDWTPLGRAGMPTAVVAIGEMDVIEPAEAGKKGGAGVTLQELLAELKKQGASPAQVVGEMGWKPKDVLTTLGLKFEELAGEIGGEAWAGTKARADAVGEIATALGLAKDVKPADIVAAAKAAREAQIKVARAERDALIDRVIGEMVVAEAARSIVKRMLQLPEQVDEAAVKKAVGELVAQEDVKAAMASVFKQDVVRPVDAGRDGAQSGLIVRRVAI